MTPKEILFKLNIDWETFLKAPNEMALQLIEAGMREGIKASAKAAKCVPIEYSKEQRQMGCPAKVICAVDKKSILKLLQEINTK